MIANVWIVTLFCHSDVYMLTVYPFKTVSQNVAAHASPAARKYIYIHFIHLSILPLVNERSSRPS